MFETMQERLVREKRQAKNRQRFIYVFYALIFLSIGIIWWGWYE